MESQSNTTATVTETASRARRWRYHTAVQAARMLNAVADVGDRSHDDTQQTPWTGRAATPAR